MTAPKTAVAVVDPYDHTKRENQLSNQRPNAVALAQRSPVGRIVLAEGSQFMQLAAAAGLNAPMMALELASVVARKPAILECKEASIIAFMLDAAKLRLTIGRGIYPVPIKGKLEGWVGYKGAKELACRGGAIRDAWATVVFEGDTFKMVEAPIPTVTEHVYGPNKGKMAKAIAVYCTLLYPGGRTRSKVFDREKIEWYRNKNRSWKDADSPWQTATEEMWLAKAILHTVGDLPHSSPELAHLRDLLEREEREPAPALPSPAEPANTDEGAEDLDTAPAAEPTPEQRLAAAHGHGVRFKSGQVRFLSELRNAQIERLRTQARERLDEDPENEDMQRLAGYATLVLEARADGRSVEPAPAPVAEV